MSQNPEKTWSAFVIMPFEAEFDVIYNDLIVPPMQSAGFQVYRADSNPHQQNILKSIIEGISKADLIIAELTLLNANVMYELGIAHTLYKPTVMLTKDLQGIPFDLRSYVLREYSENYRSAEALKTWLKEVAEQHKTGVIHFGNPVSDFAPDTLQNLGYSAQLSNSMQVISSLDADDEELGMLDYAVEVENAIAELSQQMMQMLELTTDIGQKINSRAAELQYAGNLASQGIPQSARQRQQLVNFAASDIRNFANYMRSALVKYRSAWVRLENNLTSMLTSTVIQTEEDKNAVVKFSIQMESLRIALGTSGSGVEVFRNAVARLPNASRELRQASQLAASTLDDVIKAFSENRASLDNFRLMSEQLLNNSINTNDVQS